MVKCILHVWVFKSCRSPRNDWEEYSTLNVHSQSTTNPDGIKKWVHLITQHLEINLLNWGGKDYNNNISTLKISNNLVGMFVLAASWGAEMMAPEHFCQQITHIHTHSGSIIFLCNLCLVCVHSTLSGLDTEGGWWTPGILFLWPWVRLLHAASCLHKKSATYPCKSAAP